LLVGLKDGQILKIFVDNPFPQLLLKHSSCIRCLDLSMSRRQLAVVDDTSTAVIYDVVSNRETYRDSNVSSVAFNSVYEDMLCYSGQNTLSIRTSDFEPHREKLVGFVVGVKGSKVFCLQMDSMKTVDVPQSASMHKFLQKGDIIGAHAIALLGVTESDWRLLGDAALRKLEFDLARQAYIRVRDVRTVTFIKRLEAMKKDPRVKNPQLSALIHCFHGNFTAASAAYCSIGMHEAAIEMFSELRMYKEAQRVAQETAGVDVNALFRKQALWEQESGDKAAAARLWVALGEWSLAVSNMVAEGMVDDLVKAVRKIPAEFKDAFGAAVGALRKLGKTDIAIEAVMKVPCAARASCAV
jgi:intraflagellar transport protein 122